MSPAISVIVAIYNAETSLPRCLDSLKNQTMKDLEFVLVDDGSTDSSLHICQSYAQKDPRFKVYHKQNEGVSLTRQYGLDRATGAYVIHLDADDFVDTRIYQEMYDEALRKSADIVFVDILRLEPNGQASLLKNRLLSWSHEYVLDRMIYKLFGSLCNRLVKRDLFDKYVIHFPKKMQYLEDKLILIQLLSRSLNAGDRLKFGHVSKPYLFYDTTVNDNSLTKLSSKDKFKSRFSYWEKAGEELNMNLFGKTYYSLLLEYGFNVLWNHTLPESHFQELFSPYQEQIRHYAPSGSRKYLVLHAINHGYRSTDKRRWCAFPLVLLDKLRISLNKFEAKIQYKTLQKKLVPSQ